MKVKITQQHLNDGIQCSETGCALYLALRPLFKPEFGLVVESDCVKIINGNGWNFFRLNDKAQQFVYDFDNGNFVKPFTLTFDGRHLKRYLTNS